MKTAEDILYLSGGILSTAYDWLKFKPLYILLLLIYIDIDSFSHSSSIAAILFDYITHFPFFFVSPTANAAVLPSHIKMI